MLRIVQHLVIFFLLTGMINVQASSEKLSILSTIKPIHLIVQEIIGDHANAIQLIPDYASPHNYSFKPSDIRKIKNAALIFRIDEHMEAILNPVLETHAKKDRLISLAEVDGITLLPISGKHKHESSSNEADEHGNVDLHIWTSPSNILIMAKTITEKLSEIDKQNAATYNANLKQFKTKLLKISQAVKEELSNVKNKPYLVFHNGWQYFSESFGLQKADAINMHEGLSGDISSIREARKKIKSENISCVFSDPSISTARIKTLIENTKVNTAEIDVLASGLTTKEGAIFEWISSMSSTINQCLGPRL